MTEVTVRYFAAARAAAGVDEEQVTVPSGTSVGVLIELLGAKNDEMARVLPRCSYLCDGIAVRDVEMPLGTQPTLDVLPPFAGG